MGLHDRLRSAGVESGGPLEPVRIPALNLVDAFEAFDPWAGQVSPYRWAPLQRPQRAVGGSPAAPPDDPEGLNALAARARRLVGRLRGDPSTFAATLDAGLVDPDPFGEPELPPVGDGTLAERLVARADALDGPGHPAPSQAQWLGILALALLGKAEQLIREIDRDAERIFAPDPTESEFFENDFNIDRLDWFRHLAAECAQAVAAAKAIAQMGQHEKRNRQASSQNANDARHAARRKLQSMVEAIYCEEYCGRGVSDKQIAREIWPRIEAYNRLPDGRLVTEASEPWITPLPLWISDLKQRYGERTRSKS